MSSGLIKLISLIVQCSSNINTRIYIRMSKILIHWAISIWNLRCPNIRRSTILPPSKKSHYTWFKIKINHFKSIKYFLIFKLL